MKEPLILTLKIDDASQVFFDRQRELYFPKHVNYLKAHLTLFHALPPDEPVIAGALNALRNILPFEVSVVGLHNIGKGVVYKIESPELQALHRQLQEQFDQYLIRQDRQPLWPHITVQNKVTAGKAAETFKELQAAFQQRKAGAVGISAWTYLGGPWRHESDYSFGPNAN